MNAERQYFRFALVVSVVYLFLLVPMSRASTDSQTVHVLLVPGTATPFPANRPADPIHNKQPHPAIGQWTPTTNVHVSEDINIAAVRNTGDAALVLLKPLLPPHAKIKLHIVASGEVGIITTWQGDNTTEVRRYAAAELERWLRDPANSGEKDLFFAVSYSHGDTILSDAITLSKKPFEAVISLAAPGVNPKPEMVKRQINFVFKGDVVVKIAGEVLVEEQKPAVPSPGAKDGATNIVLDPPPPFDPHNGIGLHQLMQNPKVLIDRVYPKLKAFLDAKD